MCLLSCQCSTAFGACVKQLEAWYALNSLSAPGQPSGQSKRRYRKPAGVRCTPHNCRLGNVRFLNCSAPIQHDPTHVSFLVADISPTRLHVRTLLHVCYWHSSHNILFLPGMHPICRTIRWRVVVRPCTAQKRERPRGVGNSSGMCIRVPAHTDPRESHDCRG